MLKCVKIRLKLLGSYAQVSNNTLEVHAEQLVLHTARNSTRNV